jgi:sec-independent protein translocase protein TatB
MLDVGWSEILIIAVVAMVVVGPKELPQLLRTAGQWAAKARRMAGEFQVQMNQALREADLDDVRKSVEDLKSLSPKAMIAEQLGSMTETLAQAERETNAELARIEAGVATPAETAGAPLPLVPEPVPFDSQALETPPIDAPPVDVPAFDPPAPAPVVAEVPAAAVGESVEVPVPAAVAADATGEPQTAEKAPRA